VQEYLPFCSHVNFYIDTLKVTKRHINSRKPR